MLKKINEKKTVDEIDASLSAMQVITKYSNMYTVTNLKAQATI